MSHFDHLAVPVDDIDVAAAFYEQWLGAQRIPSPSFPVPVLWLTIGALQIHLIERPDEASGAYHFALTLDTPEQFVELYRRAEREGNFAGGAFAHRVYETTDGVAQLYLGDPSGNVVECAYHTARHLAPDILAGIRRWSDGVAGAARDDGSIAVDGQTPVEGRS